MEIREQEERSLTNEDTIPVVRIKMDNPGVECVLRAGDELSLTPNAMGDPMVITVVGVTTITHAEYIASKKKA